jgi:hypothetical protein
MCVGHPAKRFSRFVSTCASHELMGPSTARGLTCLSIPRREKNYIVLDARLVCLAAMRSPDFNQHTQALIDQPLSPLALTRLTISQNADPPEADPKAERA